MSLPTPPVSLDGHCSAIYNNTLYTYQWNAFQSLPLQEGGTWSQLPMGVALNGSKCVLGTSAGQDAMFVVGGTTNSSDNSYRGLQWYKFGDTRWTSEQSDQSVTQNRQMHGAAYLNDTSSILVYSGFQDDSYTMSSQTFTVSTSGPYVMKSFPASSPPVMSPTVLPWNSSHAVMVGGNPTNKEVWVFGEATGWQQLDVTLPDSIADMTKVQAALVQGTNGAKALELFDMSTSPNSITALLIQSANSNSKAVQVVPSGKVGPSTLQPRDVDLSAWPAYNGTLAPAAQRNGSSLAQSPSGLVVVSGGENSSTNDPFCMFNQTGNTWISSKQFFGVQDPILSGSPSSTPAPSIPASPAATTSAPATAGVGNDSSRVTLGAVLGGLFGFLAILVFALLLLRYKKSRRQAKTRDPSNFPQDTKHQMGFDDSAAVASFDRSKQGSGSSNHSGAAKLGFFHKASGSAGSVFGKKISTPRLASESPSPDNNYLTVNPRGLAEPAQSGPKAGRTEPRGDEGWSRYFSNGNSNNELGPNGAPQASGPAESTSRNTQLTDSDYDTDSHTNSYRHESAEPAPLNIRSSGYPQSEESWERSRFHPRSQHISYKPGTAVSHVSEEGPEDFLDPASSSSGTQAWDPIGTSDGQSTFEQRPASSIYAESFNYHHPGERVHLGSFPAVPSTTRPVVNNTGNSWQQSPEDMRGLKTMATKDFGRKQSQPQEPKALGNSSGGARNEDMSWLNLGR